MDATRGGVRSRPDQSELNPEHASRVTPCEPSVHALTGYGVDMECSIAMSGFEPGELTLSNVWPIAQHRVVRVRRGAC